jgi:hypothetical protein
MKINCMPPIFDIGGVFMFVGKDEVVQAHMMKRSLTEVVITPAHAKRKESKEFKASKKRLRQDGHYKCWVCGSTQKLQVHHYGGEWSLESSLDLNLLKEFLMEWDVYGYSRLMRNLPLTTVDDVRNMMVLCQKHHTGKEHGIHEITFPVWITQKLDKVGHPTIPGEGMAYEEDK